MYLSLLPVQHRHLESQPIIQISETHWWALNTQNPKNYAYRSWLSFAMNGSRQISPYLQGHLTGTEAVIRVTVKHPWHMWVNISQGIWRINDITKVERSTMKPCAYYVGCIVFVVPDTGILHKALVKNKVNAATPFVYTIVGGNHPAKAFVILQRTYHFVVKHELYIYIYIVMLLFCYTLGILAAIEMHTLVNEFEIEP